MHDESPFNLPEPLIRVTGGSGGEAILILGTEKRDFMTVEWHVLKTSS